jgi:hypothetical protein
MTGRGVEAIPILSAADVGVASLAVLLAVLPNPEPAVRLVVPAGWSRSWGWCWPPALRVDPAIWHGPTS